MDLKIEVPPKPENIDLVPDPLNQDLELKMVELRSLLHYATLLRIFICGVSYFSFIHRKICEW